MTTFWKPAGEWCGQTVAVMAAGPTMSRALAQSLRRHRTIAVTRAAKLAPWADMLIALDPNWPPEYRAFRGMRVTGVEDGELDALYIGHRSESVMLRPGHIVSLRNSGLMAVRIAAEMGAQRILLAGFAPDVPKYFDGLSAGPYVGVTEGLRQIAAELSARGVIVERVESRRRRAQIKPQ